MTIPAALVDGLVLLQGRHVVVFAGILPIMRDEDGLAVVMGHEIAHCVARHSAEKMSLYAVLWTHFS
jgi:Zn-dependent protease with chaperone function